MSDPGQSPMNDKMRDRADESSWKLWLLMDADRYAVAAFLLLLVFLSFLFIGIVDPGPLQQSVESSDPNETLFQALLGSIITGVTLVVTLNQLVLSQELGPIGDQRERMEKAMQFREDAGKLIDSSVSPADPSRFFGSLIDEIRSRAEALEDEERLEEFIEGLEQNSEKVSRRLEDAEFGTFDLLSAVLNFNYSWKLVKARQLRKGEDLSGESREKLEDIEEVLEMFGPAREHFKTLYFQWELINLSRAMLYAAIPALIVSASMIIYYDASAVAGAVFGVSNDVVLTSLAVSISLMPFVLLLSYILRIATVAKRTLSIGPFVLRDTDRG